jgi:hypothetical protein
MDAANAPKKVVLAQTSLSATMVDTMGGRCGQPTRRPGAILCTWTEGPAI